MIRGRTPGAGTSAPPSRPSDTRPNSSLTPLAVRLLLPSPASASIKAATAGSRRSFSRQRRRVGPMLPTGMPSSALISAYGTGGSWISMAISRWQPGGRRMNASRSAALRSAKSSSCVRPSQPVHPGPSRHLPRTWHCPVPARCPASDRIPAGWWWPASQEARPDRGFCQAAPAAAADALADVIGVGAAQPDRRQMDQSSGRTARPVRPTPACRHPSRGSQGQ